MQWLKSLLQEKSGNPAEEDFITAEKCSENTKQRLNLGLLCTWCVIPHLFLLFPKRQKLKLCMVHVSPRKSPRVRLRNPEHASKVFASLYEALNEI
jgi:hypothetical protein